MKTQNLKQLIFCLAALVGSVDMTSAAYAQVYMPPAAWVCPNPRGAPRVTPYSCGVTGCGWIAFMFNNGNPNRPIAWSATYNCDRFSGCTITANCRGHRVSAVPAPMGTWKWDGYVGSVSGYTSCCQKLWGITGNWRIVR